MRFSVVDLPQPEGPKRPTSWPSGISKVKSFTAITSPCALRPRAGNFFVKCSSRTLIKYPFPLLNNCSGNRMSLHCHFSVLGGDSQAARGKTTGQTFRNRTTERPFTTAPLYFSDKLPLRIAHYPTRHTAASCAPRSALISVPAFPLHSSFADSTGLLEQPHL